MAGKMGYMWAVSWVMKKVGPTDGQMVGPQVARTDGHLAAQLAEKMIDMTVERKVEKLV